MKSLERAIRDEIYLLDVDARDVNDVFGQALSHLVNRGRLSEKHREAVLQGRVAQEQQLSTAIGHALAVPHYYLDVLDESHVLFVRLAKPLNLGARDGIPTRYLFMLLGPTRATAEHLDTLANIARLMSDYEFRYDLGEARNGDDLLAALQRFIKRAAPPEIEEREAPPALEYTGKLCGGLVQDVRRRLPWYLSDLTDGLHSKTVASVLFLFFACLAPAVTLGGVMSVETGGAIGAVEMVAATVRSLNRLRSIATVEEVVDQSGERHDRIIHVRENRVTALVIHLLVGLSLLLLPLLKTISMAVLYGLFLFMGVVSMKGNQFFERLNPWPMDSSLYPSTHYIRKVPNRTIHKYTLLRAVCLAVLWFVKVSALGILFPLFIALLVPVRMLVGRVFAPEHLEALDAEEDPESEETRRTE